MITSETITSIAPALLGFHKEVGKIKKDASNPFFKTKYADLPNILDAIRDPLNNNGLVITQFPDCENMLTTRLIHTSGEWMQSSFELKPVPQLDKREREYITPQAQGSAITYARRYAISAILSLNIDEDDDGNQASGKTIPVKRPPSTTGKPLISKMQWSNALKRIDAGETDVITKLQEAFTLTPEQLSILNKKK